jgi:transcriptional regulator with XRE-family HTH domain
MSSAPHPRAERLRAKRESFNLTQEQLAELAGVAEGTLRDLELQRRPWPKFQLHILMRLAIVLRCSVNDLIEDHWWDLPGPRLSPARKPGLDPVPRGSCCKRCGGLLNRLGGKNGDEVCVSCGQTKCEAPKGILSLPLPKRPAA